MAEPSVRTVERSHSLYREKHRRSRVPSGMRIDMAPVDHTWWHRIHEITEMEEHIDDWESDNPTFDYQSIGDKSRNFQQLMNVARNVNVNAMYEVPQLLNDLTRYRLSHDLSIIKTALATLVNGKKKDTFSESQ